MKGDIDSCASIFDCEKKNSFDLKLSHRILILAGYYVSEDEVQLYMESISKNVLTLEELKEYSTKNRFRNPPNSKDISNLFRLLNVNNSNEIDLDLLKYGLTSIGNDKFNSLELEDFFNKLDIDSSGTRSILINKVVENLSKMLSIYE